MPGSAVLNALQGAIGKAALEETAKKLAAHFQSRPFMPISS